MIHIDDIKFDFSAVDEAFARNLYVRWDVFYRDALRSVIEDFLSRHDEEGLLVKLEQLELNLGNIPQDDFYRQFPIRLKEELENTFTYNIRLNGVQESRSEQIARRLSNLMFYIEKGFCSTVWEYAEFDLERELQFLLLNDPRSLAYLLHRIVRYPNYLNRLAWSIPVEQLGKLLLVWLEEESLPQVEKEMRLMELEKENGLLKTYLRRATGSLPGLSEKISVLMSDEKGEDFMAWLLNTTLSMYEKRRSLAILLGTRPHIVIGFIHETQDEKAIRSLAELLDKVMIRQIIDAECENHTEIDVPAYWMYLYSWLVENYPFNGVYQFGNKLQFKEYLNVKLLQFIKKRPYSAYLSKTELTVQFLIKVFGREYYLNVLNIIYNQQARNADGSPIYTGYFNMELYYMFLRLSLIKFPVREEKVLMGEDFSDTLQGKDLRLEDVRFLMKWLANEDVSESEKRNFMVLVAEEYPYFLSLLVRKGGVNRELLSLLATYMDMVVIRRLISRECSCYATEVVMELTKSLLSRPDTIEWLSELVAQDSEYHVRITLLDWLNRNGNTLNAQRIVTSFLHLLFVTVSGHIQLSDADKERVEGSVNKVLKLLHLGEDAHLIKELGLQAAETNENRYQLMIEKFLDKPMLFALWVKENGENDGTKKEVLKYFASHYPHELSKLLRQSALEPEVLSILVRQWGVESVMDFIGCLHFFYSEVLNRLKGLLNRIPASFSAIIRRDEAEIEQHFARALIYWLSDEKTFGTSFVTEGVVRQLVFCLHLSYTGRPMYGQSEAEWKEMTGWLMKELETEGDDKEDVNKVLMPIGSERMDEQIEKQENLPSLQRWLAAVMEQYPVQWLDYMEHGSEQILENIVAKAMNPVLMERLIGIVGASVTPAYTTSFRRVIGWMKLRVGQSDVGILFRSLLVWMRTESWRNMNSEQIEMFFFASMEQLDWLNDTTMDHDLKCRILQQHFICHPERVFLMVWESIRNNKLHPEDWAKWLDGKDWVRLVGSYSLYKAELLEQVLEYLSENNLIKETQLSVVLANYLTRRNPVFIMQEKDSEMVSRLVQSIQQSANEENVSQESLPVVELVKNIMDELQINDVKNGLVQDILPEEPEYISVSNAGLALLAPWFPRLFDMLELLDEERKDFKDSESRIRAIYILQRLVTLEEKGYQEKELAFNRILVSFPFTEPLPPKMELTKGEVGIVESMLNGVKANWEKMNNSSVRGLQYNFIVRNGHIVQQEKKWTLTVESRSYDMLLDSVPWSYKIISFPWLKKPIYVSWREKEDY